MRRLEDTPVRMARRERQATAYWQKRARGQCPGCGAAVERFAYCRPCREARNAWVKERKR